MSVAASAPTPEPVPPAAIDYISYSSEAQLPLISRLIEQDLSEPYSVYTYRFFLNNWPDLCILAMHEGQCIGVIVCRLDHHRNQRLRGYIAMLAVSSAFRKNKIGSSSTSTCTMKPTLPYSGISLVKKAIQRMQAQKADEVVLEAEVTNSAALALYEQLGFVRDKRLYRYYLNGVDAYRLKLWLT